MDPIETLGLVAGGLTTAAFVPQALRTVRTGSASDFSRVMLLLFAGGVVMWLAYGVMAGLVSVVAANAATLLLTLPILWVKFRGGPRAGA